MPGPEGAPSMEKRYKEDPVEAISFAMSNLVSNWYDIDRTKEVPLFGDSRRFSTTAAGNYLVEVPTDKFVKDCERLSDGLALSLEVTEEKVRVTISFCGVSLDEMFADPTSKIIDMDILAGKIFTSLEFMARGILEEEWKEVARNPRLEEIDRLKHHVRLFADFERFSGQMKPFRCFPRTEFKRVKVRIV